MDSSFKIGKIAGIAIGVHWSWFLILLLITWSFAGGILLDTFPEWSETQRWVVGVVIALIFFVSILLHELSHSFVAKARGIEVKGITLFVFGGVSNLGREAESAGEEFQIAIVGPLTSLLIGGLFAGLWAVLRGPAPNWADVAFTLAFINVVIAAFNMLPGFPLDGGRVFRSIIWARNRNLLRATRIASRTGSGIAYLMMAAGGLVFISSAETRIAGIWLVMIGLFLRSAAGTSYEQIALQQALEGLSAREVARNDYPLVSPEMPVAELMGQFVLAGRGRCFPVVAGRELLGLVTISDMQSLDRAEWPVTSVYRVMTPFAKLQTAAPEDGLLKVLQVMGESGVSHVPIVDGNVLLGMIGREDILRVEQVRREVGVDG